jgi:uncharacterized protein (DUF58 family)
MPGARRGGTAPRPTRRGVGVIALLAGLVALAVGTDTGELLPLTVAVAIAVVAAPMAAFLRARRARARLAVTATASPPLSVVGGEVSLVMAVTNRTSGRAPALSIASPTASWRPRPLGPAPASASAVPRCSWLVPAGLQSLGACPPGRVVDFTSPVPSRRRGAFVLRLGHVWVLDPLGLFGAPGPPVPPATAVFYPAADLDGDWPAPRRREPTSASTAPESNGGRDGSGDLVGIRPYVAGDRLSLLHWPARARTGAWFVRQFAPEFAPAWRLVLDDRLGVHRQRDFEAMVARAHGMVLELWDEGRTVELCTLSGTSRLLPPVPAGLEEGRVVLATVLPRHGAGSRPLSDAGGGDGTVLTTVTGARSLPDDVERIVVGS